MITRNRIYGERLEKAYSLVIDSIKTLRGIEETTVEEVKAPELVWQQRVSKLETQLMESASSLEQEKKENTRIARELQVQIRAMGHIKPFQQRYHVLRRLVIEDKVRLVENGINPLNGEKEGRYALVNEHGKIVALSKRAKSAFGYTSSLKDYSQIIYDDSIKSLGEIREPVTLKEMQIKLAEGERRIKEIVITPVKAHDAVLGYVVDFKQIAWLEKMRERLASMKQGKIKRQIQVTIDSVAKSINAKSSPEAT